MRVGLYLLMIMNIANISVNIFLATQTVQFSEMQLLEKNFFINNILASCVILVIIFTLLVKPIPFIFSAVSIGCLIAVLIDIYKLAIGQYWDNLQFHMCILDANIILTVYILGATLQWQLTRQRRINNETTPLINV